MARKVWLTITGIQKGFDQEEPVTLVTEGSYIHKNGVHYIFYSERTEEGAVIKNRLTISPGNVELRKTGAGNFNSVLVFEAFVIMSLPAHQEVSIYSNLCFL